MKNTFKRTYNTALPSDSDDRFSADPDELRRQLANVEAAGLEAITACLSAGMSEEEAAAKGLNISTVKQEVEKLEKSTGTGASEAALKKPVAEEKSTVISNVNEGVKLKEDDPKEKEKTEQNVEPFRIPEGYPGAGKPLGAELTGSWLEIEEHLNSLKVRNTASLERVGSIVLSTKHGPVTIRPSIQIYCKLAALHFDETVQLYSSALMMRNLYEAYRYAMTEKLPECPGSYDLLETLEVNKVSNWVLATAPLVFSIPSLKEEGFAEKLKKTDCEEAYKRLREVYPDAAVIFSAMTTVVVYGKEVVFPLPDFLRYNHKTAYYLDQFCKGSLPASALPYDVLPRIASPLPPIPASYLALEEGVLIKDEEVLSLEEEAALESTFGYTEEDLKKMAEQIPEIPSDGGKIRLGSQEYNLADLARHSGNRGRDTLRFREGIVGLTLIMDRIDQNSSRMTTIEKAIDGVKVEVSEMKAAVRSFEGAVLKELNDLSTTMAVLVSQRSYSTLQSDTSLNSERFLYGPTGLGGKLGSSFVLGGGSQSGQKGLQSGEIDLTTRLKNFEESAGDALCAELKTLFINAGQKSIAEGLSIEVLKNKEHRTRLITLVKRYS